MAGHQAGADKILEFLDWCEDLNIKMVTLYMLSTDNLNREASELRDLLEVIGGTRTTGRNQPGESSTGWRQGFAATSIGSEAVRLGNHYRKPYWCPRGRGHRLWRTP